MTFKERLAQAEAKANIQEVKKRASTPFWVDIENGVYTCTPVKAECTVTDNNIPIWRLGFLVSDGSEGDGKTLPVRIAMDTEERLERAYRVVAALGYDIADEDFSLADSLDGINEELLEKQPDVKIRVSTTVGKEGTDNAGKTFQNFDIQQSDWGEEGESEEVPETPAPKPAAKPAAAPAKAGKAAAKPEPKPEPKPAAKAGKGRVTAAEKTIAAAAVDDDEEEPEVAADDTEEGDDEAEIDIDSTVRFTFKGEEVVGVIKDFVFADGDADDAPSKFKAKVEGRGLLTTKLENIMEVIS